MVRTIHFGAFCSSGKKWEHNTYDLRKLCYKVGHSLALFHS